MKYLDSLMRFSSSVCILLAFSDSATSSDEKVKQIYFIRHARSTWNDALDSGLYQTAINLRITHALLTKDGNEQTQKLAYWLQSNPGTSIPVNPDEVYHKIWRNEPSTKSSGAETLPSLSSAIPSCNLADVIPLHVPSGTTAIATSNLKPALQTELKALHSLFESPANEQQHKTIF